MAYTKTTWIDRVVQYPTKYTASGAVTGDITLTANPGTVTQAGTPVNASNLNKIETAIFDLDAKVNFTEAWATPTLSNSWVAYDTLNGSFAYKKDGNGVVWVRGAIKSGTLGAVIYTMPSGYRPTKVQNFSGCSGDYGGARIKVGTDGTVEVNGGSNTLITTCFCYRTD